MAEEEGNAVPLSPSTAALAAALTKIANDTVAFIGGKGTGAPALVNRGPLFEGIAALATSPLSDAALAVRMLGACRKSAKDEPGYSSMVQRTISRLGSHPGLRSEEIQPFVDEYIGVLRNNMTDAPTLYGGAGVASTPQERRDAFAGKLEAVKDSSLLEIALGGLVSLFGNPNLSRTQQEQILRYLLPILNGRVAKREAFFKSKKEPPPDPFYDILLSSLRTITDSEYIDPTLKTVVERDLEKAN